MPNDLNAALVDAGAKVLFFRHYVNREDASEEWAEMYWRECANAPHKGDCPHAEHKGPITCDRCVCDEFREDVNAVTVAIRDALPPPVMSTAQWLVGVRQRVAAMVPPGPDHDAAIDRRMTELLALEVPTNAELLAIPLRELPTDDELVAMQQRGELPTDAELEKDEWNT